MSVSPTGSWRRPRRPRDLVAAVIAAGPGRPEVPVTPRPRLAPAEAAPVSAATLVEVLAWHVEAVHPERVHIMLCRGRQEQSITYGALWQRAVQTAAGAARARRGARAIVSPSC